MHHETTPESPIFELAEELVESWRGITRCTAGFLRALGEFDRRHGYNDWGYVDTAQWLDAECGISRVTAREKVRVARELEGLGKIAEAFADGSLSYSKVRALTRLADLGNEGALLDLALKCPASELETRLREMENGGALSPGDGEGKARHRLTSHQGTGDRVRISVELSREDAGIVMEALEVAKGEIAECELGGPRRGDEPSLAADALLLMAKRTLSGCFRGSARAGSIWFRPDTSGCLVDEPTPEQSGPAHLVMVHVEESVLRGEGGTSDLPTPAVRRLLCDGAVVGIVDDAGRHAAVDRAPHPDGSSQDAQGAEGARPHLPLSGVPPRPLAGRAPRRSLGGRRRDEPREPHIVVHAPPQALARGRVRDPSARDEGALLLREAGREGHRD